MSVGGINGSFGIVGIVNWLIMFWVLVGGLVLLLVVVVNMVLIIGGLFGKFFLGDFELIEMGVVVVVFVFLFYC